MDRKTNLIPALLLSALSLYAMEDVKVTQFQHAGPFTVNKPILADSLNVNGKPFEAKNLLKATLPFEQTLANATVLDADTAGAITFAAPQKGYALHLFSFFLNSDRYVKGTLDISGPGAFEVFVNDKPVGASSELVMEPQRVGHTLQRPCQSKNQNGWYHRLKTLDETTPYDAVIFRSFQTPVPGVP